MKMLRWLSWALQLILPDASGIAAKRHAWREER